MSRHCSEYTGHVSVLLSRVLSLQNRNPISATYGCLDRNFWHFKTLVDFPSATYQQPVLGLSSLWEEAGAFSGSHDLSNAIRGGILYWCEIQNRDGSFNEYYQNDRSFCPTAFTTFGVAFAFKRSRELFDPPDADRILRSLNRSAAWLARQENPSVVNQMMASALALRAVADLTSDVSMSSAASNRLTEVLASQSEEGWFPEYDGADVGYSMLALDMLALYDQSWPERRVRDASERLAAFIVGFLHPDGTAGGHYGSRSTQHVFPFGIEYFAQQGSAPARAARAWLRNHLKLGTGLTSLAVDDKYVAYFYFNSYVMALLTAEEIDDAPQDLPAGTMDYSQARILRVQEGPLKGWIGYGRNGVCRFYEGEKLAHVDGGYVIRLADGRQCASQVADPGARLDLDTSSSQSIQVEGRVGLLDDSLPLVRWIVPFKLFCRTVLKFDGLAYWFHRYIKGQRIVRTKQEPVSITRLFSLLEKEIVIEDRLESSGSEIAEAYLMGDFSTVHSPSSRYVPVTSTGPVAESTLDRPNPSTWVFTHRISLDNGRKSNG